MPKENEGGSNHLQKINQEKRRLSTFCKQESSPTHKNTILAKKDSQQALSEMNNGISYHNFPLVLNNEKQLFDYYFEEGQEFKAYYPHNNIREVIKKLLYKMEKVKIIKIRKIVSVAGNKIIR